MAKGIQRVTGQDMVDRVFVSVIPKRLGKAAVEKEKKALKQIADWYGKYVRSFSSQLRVSVSRVSEVKPDTETTLEIFVNQDGFNPVWNNIEFGKEFDDYMKKAKVTVDD